MGAAGSVGSNPGRSGFFLYLFYLPYRRSLDVIIPYHPKLVLRGRELITTRLVKMAGYLSVAFGMGLERSRQDILGRMAKAQNFSELWGPCPTKASLDEYASVGKAFPDPVWDTSTLAIGVTIPPITMRTTSGLPIDLGAFQVWISPTRSSRLPERTNGIGHKNPWAVALSPNPSLPNRDVVHPHVCRSDICMGEAAVPIQSSLEQGLILEALYLVRSVLLTYNPGTPGVGGPYVRLDDWFGYSCCGCGRMVPSRDCSCYMNHILCSSCTDHRLACGCFSCPVCEDADPGKRCHCCPDQMFCGAHGSLCVRCKSRLCYNHRDTYGSACRCRDCGLLGCPVCVRMGRCLFCRTRGILPLPEGVSRPVTPVFKTSTAGLLWLRAAAAAINGGNTPEENTTDEQDQLYPI